MFNTMTVTKAAGALIGSLLVLLLVSWGASALYHVGPAGHAGDEEAQAQAYTIEVDDDDSGDKSDSAEEEPDVATLMESADASAGEKVFSKCKACHKLDDQNATGPHLDGVVDRPVASVDDFAYSDAMKEHASEVPEWDAQALFDFLENPKKVVPGTKMSFAGLPKPADRANIIAYLAEQ